jgi:DNA-binding winged helix-turn-helix (wHTH) protein/tetratricopeptide (TPR) repeat protein
VSAARYPVCPCTDGVSLLGESRFFRFGEYEVDTQLWELRAGGRPLAIQAKPLSLLVYLLRNADRVVSNEELLDSVWAGIHVNEAALKTAVRVLRRTLGDSASDPRWITNARRRGYRFHGPLQVLGADGQPADAPPVAEPAARSDDFVGREDQLAQLRTELEGPTRVVLLHGPPGVGKTRTASELARDAVSRGFEAHVGRTHDGEGAPPFWPWIEILRSWFDARSPEEAGRNAHAHPDLCLLLPELAEEYGAQAERTPTDSAQHARFRMFDQIARFLRASSLRRPLLLVIDDLQWADDDSLALLLFLARRAAGMQGLILGTHRDGIEDGERMQRIAAVQREPGTRSLALRGLERDAVDRIVRERVAGPLADAHGERIFDATGGNPLFVLELTKSLAADDGAALRALERLPISERLREAVGSRMRECSLACQQVLRTLCVEPAGLRLAVLRRALPLDGPELLATLGEAERAGYVARRGESFQFAHDVLREALYEELAPSDRLGLHCAVGEAIDAVGGPDAIQVLGQTAHHFTESAALAHPQRAVEHAQRAAEGARDVRAYADAAALYRRALRALEFVEQPSEELRCVLLICLGDMLGEGREHLHELQRILLQAMELARKHGWLRLWAVAAERCTIHMGARYFIVPVLYAGAEPITERLEAALEAVLPELEVNADALLRARVLLALYMLRAYRGAHEAARTCIDEAEKLSRPLADSLLRAEVLMAQWNAGVFFDRREEWRTYPATLLRHARSLGRLDLESHARRRELYIALERADRDGAERVVRRLERLVERCSTARTSLCFWRLLRAQLDGDTEDLLRAREEATRVAAQDHWQEIVNNVLGIHDWWALLMRGNIEPLLELVRGYYARYGFAPAVRLYLTRLLAHCGQHEEVRRDLRDLDRMLSIIPPRAEDWLHYMTVAAESCAITRDLESAPRIYAALAPDAERGVVGGTLLAHGSVARPLGSLAALLGHPDEAEHLMSKALAHARRLRSPVLVAITQIDHAAALLERASAEDLPRADTLLRSASATAESLAAEGLLERVRGLRERISRI